MGAPRPREAQSSPMPSAVRAACIVVLGIAMFAPSAAAHGAAPVRAIDTRILLDDDGEAGYVPDTCGPEPLDTACPLSMGAPDLLSLDVREAATMTGQHILWFRLTSQALIDEAAGRVTTMNFQAAGKAVNLELHCEMAVCSATGTQAVVLGPTPIGDGHPRAYDLGILASVLGVKPGDKLTAFQLESAQGANKGDAMPGTYFLGGQRVPPLPGSGVSNDPAGEYTVSGPAPLLSATLDDVAQGEATITLKGEAGGLPQTVLVANAGPAAVAVDPTSLILQSSAGRTLSITWGDHEDGVARIVATSDLGGYLQLDVALPEPVHGHGNVTVGPDGSTTTLPPASTPSTGTSKSSPAPALAVLAVAFLAAALARRP